MIDIYLSNSSVDSSSDIFQLGQIGASIHSFQHTPELLDSENIKVALIGVLDQRNSYILSSQHPSVDKVRHSFYSLFMEDDFVGQLIDLGNIKKGATFKDTEYALKETLVFLLKKNILPLVIGGGQSLTYSLFQAFESLEQSVNLLSVDSKIDIGDVDKELNKDNFLGKILVHQPNILLNYCNLGYQTYLTDPKYLSLLGELNFDSLRLGKVRSDFKESEPYIRNADLLSFDMSSLKKSEAPGVNHAGANGFLAEEACQMMRYAGLSDKLSCVGVFDFHEDNIQTNELIAQMLWYFIDGFCCRKGDFPVATKKDYTKYRVNLTANDKELVFFKSNLSERWWMEVPYPLVSSSRFERHRLIPCSYRDYLEAMKDEIPEKWLHAVGKI